MRTLAALLVALFAWTAGLRAGEPITIGEVLPVSSKVLGEERVVLVSTPFDYATSGERYPVLYMTDGPAHLLHTRGTVDHLVRNGLMPEVIIVGILNTVRSRDLTPTRDLRVDREAGREGRPITGGAPKFLEFLETELFPAIEAKYRTLPCRIFAGHSLGGLLALHTLAVRPELFNGYIAASPSLQWDGDYPLRVLGPYLKERKAAPRTLFVTMGNEEAGEERPTRFERLQGQLGRAKGEDFAWGAKAMPEESHGTVPLPSYYWGLRKVFEGYGAAPGARVDPFAGSLEDLQAHFRKLARRLGCDLQPPELSVNQMGYRLLQQDRRTEALAVFRFNAQAHPASPNVHDSLGEALEQAGAKVEALAAYEAAVALATRSGHPNRALYTRNRDRAAAALKAP